MSALSMQTPSRTFVLGVLSIVVIGGTGAACSSSMDNGLLGGDDLSNTSSADAGSSSQSGSNLAGSSMDGASANVSSNSDGGTSYDPEPWYGDAGGAASLDPSAPNNTPVQLSLGQQHSCARMQDGTVRCWGDDLEGQLGGGSRLSPVPGVSDVISVVTGLSHTCALTNTGAVFCWGANLYNQLGDGLGGSGGSELSSATPVMARLEAGKKAVRIFGLSNATCVQRDDNTLQCWGAQSTYHSDASALGTPFNAALSAKSAAAGEIVAIGAVSYNLSTNQVLLRDGTVLSALQGGVTSTAAVQMAFTQKDPSDTVVGLSGGYALLTVTASGKLHAASRSNATLNGKYCENFGCGITQIRPAASACFCTNTPADCTDGNCAANQCYVANRGAGSSQCERNEFWGPDLWLPFESTNCSRVATFANAMPNLTNLVTESSYEGPVTIPANYTDSSEAACVSDMRNGVGDGALCAPLGNGDATACVLHPIFSATDDPVVADTTSRFVSVGDTLTESGSNGFACALKSDGHVYCWGQNNVGQLGQGNVYGPQGGQYSRPAINMLKVQGPENVVELQVGASHSCARTSTNQVYCWGENAPSSPSSRVGNTNAADGAIPLAPISFVPPTSYPVPPPVDAGGG